MSNSTTPEVLRFTAPAILNALADGAYITDLDRRILFWNEAAERITGWPAAEVVGKRCAENVLCHIDKDGHPLCGREFCPLHRAIVTEKASETPLLIFAQTRSGRRVPVEVTVSPLRDADGRVIGGVELFRDATEAVAEMRRARVIQDNALRCPLPDDPRVELRVHHVPRDLVGGDFHRVEHLKGPLYAIMAADVAGHGVSAALYAMQLRALWEDLRPELHRPDRVFTAMNRRVRAIAPQEGYFATAVYAVLDAAGGTVRYARAGHPPPLVLRAGGAVEELDRGQPALGMIDDFTYEVFEAQVGVDDVLLVYTDGAVEVNDREGRELGVEGLKRLLGAARAPGASPNLGQLEEAIFTYSGAIHLADDLSLISARRT